MLREASIVQDWINEGMEKGEMKALQGAILDVLEERFGIIKKGLGKKIKAIDDPAVLKSLLKKGIKSASMEDFAQLLEELEK